MACTRLRRLSRRAGEGQTKSRLQFGVVVEKEGERVIEPGGDKGLGVWQQAVLDGNQPEAVGSPFFGRKLRPGKAPDSTTADPGGAGKGMAFPLSSSRPSE